MRFWQRGLSIIEMMITILISSILVLGVMQMFLSTSETSRTNNALSRVQENGRIALEMIATDARRTGYGCMPTEDNRQINIGSIQYPNQALDVNGNESISFSYASSDAPAANPVFVDSENCQTLADNLRLNIATYANCADGTSLCLNGDPILANARLSLIEVGIEDAGSISWITNPTALQESQASAVRITLIVSNQDRQTDTPITRDFTGTFSLRNRAL